MLDGTADQSTNQSAWAVELGNWPVGRDPRSSGRPDQGTADLGQLRGPCNSIPPKVVETAVRKWWRNARKAVKFPEPCFRHLQDRPNIEPFNANFGGDLDDEVPF